MRVAFLGLVASQGSSGADLSVAPTSNAQQSITLTFSIPGPGNAYNIYRSTESNGTYTFIHTTGTNNHSYNDTAVTCGTTYYYYVNKTIDSAEQQRTSVMSSLPSDFRPVSSIELSQTGYYGELRVGVFSTDASATADIYWKLSSDIEYTIGYSAVAVGYSVLTFDGTNTPVEYDTKVVLASYNGGVYTTQTFTSLNNVPAYCNDDTFDNDQYTSLYDRADIVTEVATQTFIGASIGSDHKLTWSYASDNVHVQVYFNPTTTNLIVLDTYVSLDSSIDLSDVLAENGAADYHVVAYVPEYYEFMGYVDQYDELASTDTTTVADGICTDTYNTNYYNAHYAATFNHTGVSETLDTVITYAPSPGAGCSDNTYQSNSYNLVYDQDDIINEMGAWAFGNPRVESSQLNWDYSPYDLAVAVYFDPAGANIQICNSTVSGTLSSYNLATYLGMYGSGDYLVTAKILELTSLQYYSDVYDEFDHEDRNDVANGDCVDTYVVDYYNSHMASVYNHYAESDTFNTTITV